MTETTEHTDTEVRALAARVIRGYLHLTEPLARGSATYEVSMGLMGEPDVPELTDALIARIVGEIATATVTLSGLAADESPAVSVGWPTDPA